MLQALEVLIVSVVSQVFMLLRIYALSGRNRVIFITMTIYITSQAIFFIVLMSMTGLEAGEFGPDIPLEEYHSKPPEFQLLRTLNVFSLRSRS